MKPLKPKHFIKETALKTNQLEHLVSDVVDFFWSDVKNKIASLDYHSVTVDNLGTFRARYAKIPHIKNKYNALLNESTDLKKPKDLVEIEVALMISKLDNLSQIIESEMERQKETKLKRREYELNKIVESKKPN